MELQQLIFSLPARDKFSELGGFRVKDACQRFGAAGRGRGGDGDSDCGGCAQA